MSRETVHKFALNRRPGWQEVAVTGFHCWVDAGVQGDELVLWALVDVSDPTETVHDIVVGWTGMPVETALPPFRTVQTPDGLVWHLFMYRGFAQ